ncbi:MAG: S8 family peptidase [Spirosomataceae bacterium]
MKKLFILLVFLSFASYGQLKVVVKFKDKNNSSYSSLPATTYLGEKSLVRRSVQNIPLTAFDFPPNPNYLQAIKENGGTILYTSRWLNAALVACSEESLKNILTLPFVSGLETAGDIRSGGKLAQHELLSPESFGLAENQLSMLESQKAFDLGFKGKGILIAIFDSGFESIQTMPAFSHLFTDKKIKFTYDFVANNDNVFDDDDHGTMVLSCISGVLPNEFSGTAPEAEVALFRTEDVETETKIEEFYWLLAAEKADSLGADIINSSLGYSIFDTPAQNYSYNDMIGNKALITRAANWAAKAGILVVTSAGNEGRSSWRYITAPADGDSVLSVGAVNASQVIASFSSVGPSAKGTIKPEIVAQGQSTAVIPPTNSVRFANGTSFSSPLIAGFAACIKQAFPYLTAYELRETIIQSGSQALSPDNIKGYGVPTFSAIEKREKAKNIVLQAEPIPSFHSLDNWIKSAISQDKMEKVTLSLLNGQTVYEANLLTFSLLDITEQLHRDTPYLITLSNGEKSVSKKILLIR